METMSNYSLSIPGSVGLGDVGSVNGTVSVQFATSSTAPDGDYPLWIHDDLGTITPRLESKAVVTSIPTLTAANSVPRFNGTWGQEVNETGVIIDDSNNVTGVALLTDGGTTITPAAANPGGATTLWADSTASDALKYGSTPMVTGAASSTANAVARFDGTSGGKLKNSTVVVDDSGNVTGVALLTDGGTTLTAAAANPGGATTLWADSTASNGLKYGSTPMVTGAASSTANAISRFDGTSGSTLKNSTVVVDDSGNVTGVVALTASGTVGANAVTSTTSVAATTAVTGATVAATGKVSSATGEIAGHDELFSSSSSYGGKWYKIYSMAGNTNDQLHLEVHDMNDGLVATGAGYGYTPNVYRVAFQSSFYSPTVTMQCFNTTRSGDHSSHIVAIQTLMPTETLDANNTSLADEGYCEGGESSTAWVAQTFTAVASGNVSKVNLKLGINYSASGNAMPRCRVRLLTYSGVDGEEASGTVLSTAVYRPLPTGDVAAVSSDLTYLFRPYVAITSGSLYSIVIDRMPRYGVILGSSNETFTGGHLAINGVVIASGWYPYFAVYRASTSIPVDTLDIYYHDPRLTLTPSPEVYVHADVKVLLSTNTPTWTYVGIGNLPSDHASWAAVVYDTQCPLTSPIEDPVPYGYVKGCTTTVDSANTVTIGIDGEWSVIRDEFNTCNISFFSTISSYTLIGSWTASTWYGIYLVKALNPMDTPTLYLCQASLQCDHYPRRRIGWVRTDTAGSPMTRPYRSRGNGALKNIDYMYARSSGSIISAGTDATFTSLDLSGRVPITATSATLRVGFNAGGTAGDTIAIRELGAALVTSAATAHYVVTSTGTAGHSQTFIVPISSALTVEYMITTSTGGTASVVVLGYQDEL